MMKKAIFRIQMLPWCMAMLLLPAGCVDLGFDEPPAGGYDPNLPVNTTIAELKSRHVPGQYEEITDDAIFDAIVVSSDKAGNYFKQLVVQDETGGIELRVEMTDMHNLYPVGRKVYIRTKDLWLGDYNGLIQLGAGVGTTPAGQLEVARIPESLTDKHIVIATFGNPVVPRTLTLDQLSLADVSTLVRLEGVQFVSGDAGQTWANPNVDPPLTLNREVEDCAKRRVILRSSGFARFAGELTPQGNGALTGILSVFRDDYQLMIRDLDDVEMTGERCSTSSTLTISALRSAFTGSQGPAPQGTIKGVVISDHTSLSVVPENLFIQDGTAGIVLRFTTAPSFPLGIELSVDVTGAMLNSFNGLLQVEGLTTGKATVEGPGNITPRDATVQQVLTNAQQWEATLVRIKDAVLGNSPVFGGEVTVTDATGAMIMFTRNQAVFAQTPLPTGQATITAIVSEFNTPQLIIRNTNDVSGGGSGGGDDIDEPFSSVPNNIDINLPGWANIAVKGSRLWRSQVFSGNHYAQGTSFNDPAAEMEAWLITPPISLDIPKKLTFESAYAFWVHDGLSVWISSNFNGTDVNGATWQELSPVLATSSDTEHAFIPSGDVDLSGFSGTVRIGFRYAGSGPGGQTTSWRIDNVKVEKW